MKKLISFTVISLIVAITFRILILELFTIPSASMAPTLQTGDKIIVSKLQYGPRLPRSGFEIPWLNLFWFLNPNARANMGKNEWGNHRLSGYSQIKHGDVTVFNYQGNMFEFYIKRCVALPGDSLQIINAKVHIDNKLQALVKDVKIAYKIYYQNLNKVYRQLDSLKESNLRLDRMDCDFFNAFWFKEPNHNYLKKESTAYIICNMSSQQKDFVENLSMADSISLYINEVDNLSDVFPYIDSLKWSKDNYGPLYIPAKGQSIVLNPKNYAVYAATVKKFENTEILNTDSGFYIGNRRITNYRFKQNYYFMMGDNRSQSMDSRYWGFVPESDIVGKAGLVLFSYKEGFRWDRMFKLVY